MFFFMVRNAKMSLSKFSSFNCLTCMSGEPVRDVCRRKCHFVLVSTGIELIFFAVVAVFRI